MTEHSSHRVTVKAPAEAESILTHKAYPTENAEAEKKKPASASKKTESQE